METDQPRGRMMWWALGLRAGGGIHIEKKRWKKKKKRVKK